MPDNTEVAVAAVKTAPTIGRVAWYRPREDEKKLIANDGIQPCAALVAYVHGERMVNLSVHDMYGYAHSVRSVSFHHGDASECPPGSCCWMPYQQKLAAKVAAEEAACEGTEEAA